LQLHRQLRNEFNAGIATWETGRNSQLAGKKSSIPVYPMDFKLIGLGYRRLVQQDKK
jgi:hypothetical protein